MTDKTVLVVEDEFGSAEVLQLMLELESYRVILAANGRDALMRIANVTPDLVLADYMMPVMNGAQLGRALRAHPATARVPIVIMSAAEESEVRREFDGYDAFLHKPYRLHDLLPLLARLLSEGERAGDAAAAPGDKAGGTKFSIVDSMRWLLAGAKPAGG